MHNLKALVLALLKSRLFIPGVALIAVFLVASRFMSSDAEHGAAALSNPDASVQATEAAVAGNDATTGGLPSVGVTPEPSEATEALGGTATDPGIASADPEPYLSDDPEDASQPLLRPSFSCAIAGLEAERLICGSAELARLDLELAEVYDRTVSNAREYDRTHGPMSSQVAFITLVQDQRSWIQGQRNRCRTEQCLSSAYQMRINYLSDYSFR